MNADKRRHNISRDHVGEHILLCVNNIAETSFSCETENYVHGGRERQKDFIERKTLKKKRICCDR